MGIRASCTECGKGYRVPHADKEWRCKACNSPLVIVEEETVEVDAVSCPECGGEVESDSRFCEECGTPLHGSRAMADKAEKRVAAGSMRKAMKEVRRLKLFLALSLFGAVLQLLVALGVIFFAEVSASIGVFLLCFSALTVGLIVLALHQVERSPFPVALALASLKTLDAILSFMSDGPWVVSLAFALFLWAIVVSAARVTRLAKEHPDLYLSRRMRGEHLKHAGGAKDGHSIARDTRQREKARSRKERRRLVLIGIGLIIVVAVGLVGLGFVTAPPSPDQTLELFAEAWNQEDVEALATFGKQEDEADWKRRILRAQERYEWGSALPRIESYEISDSTENASRVGFGTEGGMVRVRFSLEDDQWVMTSIDFRGVKHWRPA